MDDARRWYRYHPLFAEVLRTRLISGASPTEIATLHQRASAWLEQHGLLDDATRHALAAQDVDRAIRLIERAAPDLLLRSETATLLGWIEQLPTAPALDHPQICLFAAWAFVTLGRLEEADTLIQRAERRELELRQRGEVATLRAITAFGRGEIERAVGFAQAALAISEQLETGAQTMTRYGLHITLVAIIMLANLEAIRGQLRQAAETLHRALRLARQADQRGDSPMMAGMIYFGLSEALYQFNDLDAAERAARQALTSSEQARNAEIAAYSYTGLARIAQARGNAELAQQLMQQAEQRIRLRNIPYEIAYVQALQARLRLAQDDLEAAQRWAATEESAGDELSFPREVVLMALARVYTALGQLAQALRLIARLLADAQAGGQQGRVIELLMLQALALSRQPDAAGALAALVRALELAEPAGYVRLFVDEGAPMAALLAQVAGRTSPVAAYAQALLTAFGELKIENEKVKNALDPHATPDSQFSILNSQFEALTDRETEILRLIEAGASNQEIARRLVLAVGTVKAHLHRIYGKLGVESRTQAIAKARALQLL